MDEPIGAVEDADAIHVRTDVIRADVDVGLLHGRRPINPDVAEEHRVVVDGDAFHGSADLDARIPEEDLAACDRVICRVRGPGQFDSDRVRRADLPSKLAVLNHRFSTAIDADTDHPLRGGLRCLFSSDLDVVHVEELSVCRMGAIGQDFDGWSGVGLPAEQTQVVQHDGGAAIRIPAACIEDDPAVGGLGPDEVRLARPRTSNGHRLIEGDPSRDLEVPGGKFDEDRCLTAKGLLPEGEQGARREGEDGGSHESLLLIGGWERTTASYRDPNLERRTVVRPHEGSI